MEDLLAQYQRAVRAYKLSVAALVNKNGDDFDEQSREVERIHCIARMIREKLEREMLKPGFGPEFTK